MGYRTTIYLPDSYRVLLQARKDINVSLVVRKALAVELGLPDSVDLKSQLRATEALVSELKNQLAAANNEEKLAGKL